MREDLEYFAASPEDAPFSIELAGISYCDGSYRITRTDSPITVIEYVIDGEGTVSVNGKNYHPTAGDVYILRRGTNHVYYADAKNPWVKIFLNLKGDFPAGAISAYLPGDPVVIHNSSVRNQFEVLLGYTRMREKLDDTEIFRLCALEFHRLLMMLSPSVPLTQRDETERVRDFIDKNSRRIIPNDELAKLIYRSQDYMIKKFHAAYGVTPYDYQLHRKMENAKRLLCETHLPVKEIAAMLGYNDAMYFSNIFKKSAVFLPCSSEKR